MPSRAKHDELPAEELEEGEVQPVADTLADPAFVEWYRALFGVEPTVEPDSGEQQ